MNEKDTENFDSTNEEQVEEQEETEEAEEVESEEQDSDEDTTEDESEDEKVTLTKAELDKQIKEARKEQDKRWKERIKNGEKAPKKSTPSDDATLSRLEVRGVLDSDDQQYVLRFAKIEGISPVEALNDPVVKDKLARTKKERESKAATFTPKNRTAVSQSADVDRGVRQYKKDGTLPDGNPKLVSQILNKLKAEQE